MLESVYLTKSTVRGKVLGVLFSNPQQKYYLSELARLVGASVGNVQRELGRFTQDGLLHREKKGNLVFYVLNTHHALFPEIRSLVLKTVGIEGRLQALAEKRKDVRFALLYGSFARKEEHGESDVDLLIVSDGQLKGVYSALSKLEAQFSREINPTVYSIEEFRKKIVSGDRFVQHVLSRPHRILKGDLREFREISP